MIAPPRWILAGAIAAALLAAPAPAPAAGGDRTTAALLAARAEEELAARRWEEAAADFRRALEEDGTYLPARYGLARALAGGGNREEGAEALREFLGTLRAETGAPENWKALLPEAGKLLDEWDPGGIPLRKIVDDYAEDLVGIARKWAAKDPVTAARALRRSWELRPGDPRTLGIMDGLGISPKGPPTALFDGESLAGWEKANFPEWEASGGVILGNVRDGAFVARSQARFDGDFDVRMEARFTEERAGDPMFALLPCLEGDYDHYGFGILSRKVYFYDQTADGESRDIARVPLPDLEQDIDPAAWNAFELRFRGGEVVALVNGEEIARDTRPERRRGGFVGILCQDSRIAIRRVEVQAR